MAIKHIKKWFYLDISKIVDKYIIIERYKPKVKDSFNIGFAEKKAKLALDRGLSYLRTYADLRSDKELFRHLDMILGPRLKNHFLKDFIDNEEIRTEAKKIFS